MVAGNVWVPWLCSMLCFHHLKVFPVCVLCVFLWPANNDTALCLLAHSCPTLCDPVDSSQPGFLSVGILQARILEWAAIPFSRVSSQPRDQTQVSRIATDSLPAELLYIFSIFLGLYQGIELMGHLVTF